MKKKELKREIAALRAQVEMLSRQVAQQRPIVVPAPTPYVYPPTVYPQRYPYVISTSGSTTTNTARVNWRDDGDPPALSSVS